MDLIKSIAARPVQPVEAAIVRNTLLKAALGYVPEAMLQAIERLKVVGVGGCGCRSLYFKPITKSDVRVADGVGYLASGERIELMVWASEGQIAAFELVDHGGKGQLPIAESVCSWEEEGQHEARKQ